MIKYVNKTYTFGDTVYVLNDPRQVPYQLIGVNLTPSFRADEAVPKFVLVNVDEGQMELFDFQVTPTKGEATQPPPDDEE